METLLGKIEIIHSCWFSEEILEKLWKNIGSHKLEKKTI